MKKFGISQSVKRVEDPRLLIGKGRFIDDISPLNSATMVFFRSPVAHAKISRINLSSAKKIKGVLKIYTAKDLLGKLENKMDYSIIKNEDGNSAPITLRPMLAEKKVNFVGEAIVAIVAVNKKAGLDAIEAIDIDFEEYPVNIDFNKNLSLIHENTKNNIGVNWSFGDKEKIENIFSNAKHKVEIDLKDNRVLANPIETRGCFAEYKNNELHLCYNGQGVWGTKKALEKKLIVSPKKIRVSHPDVGGGFGMKSFDYPELFLVSLASYDLGKPIKWQSERQEGFLSDNDGRDLKSLAEIAFDENYLIKGLRIKTKFNLGAYCSGYAQFIQTELALKVITGAYDIQNVYFSVKGIYTNTSPVDAYRGAGRPEAIYVLERLIDFSAKVLKIDHLDLRRKNFIKKEQMPYLTQSGEIYDVGDFEKVLNKGVLKADLKGFRIRKEKSKENGKLRGLGLCFYIESILGDQKETTKIKLNKNGMISLFVGTQSNGQGHETAYAQIFHEKTGVSFDKINVVQGDTKEILKGGGTGGSRSVTMQGNSINTASDIMLDKLKKITSKVLKTNKKIIFKNGSFFIENSNNKIEINDLLNDINKKNLNQSILTEKENEVPGRSYPYGAHFAEVEIDPQTGETKCVKYTVVDDFGLLINPMLAEGQVHGGVAQGIGQAITENVVYDKEGQLLSGSFMDYAIPKADDIPSIPFFTELIPSKANEIGMKGCGEAGTVGALAAVANATLDALWETGVKKIDMPFTPFNVWKRINEV